MSPRAYQRDFTKSSSSERVINMFSITRLFRSWSKVHAKHKAPVVHNVPQSERLPRSSSENTTTLNESSHQRSGTSQSFVWKNIKQNKRSLWLWFTSRNHRTTACVMTKSGYLAPKDGSVTRPQLVRVVAQHFAVVEGTINMITTWLGRAEPGSSVREGVLFLWAMNVLNKFLKTDVTSCRNNPLHILSLIHE